MEYADKRGWRFFVSTGIGDTYWSAYYQKPGKDGIHRVRLPQRLTREEAQADLDAYAKSHGMSEREDWK